MKTSFLVIFTFFFFQRLCLSIVTASSNGTCFQSERQSLLEFKQSLSDKYNSLSTWSGVDCCEWYGVVCKRIPPDYKFKERGVPFSMAYGHVVTLDLHGLGLEGELSPSLQNLKHLRCLDLSGTRFSGKIPEFFGSFEELEYLDLSSCDFFGVVPHHLGNLSMLQVLDLKVGPFKLQSPTVDDLGWVSSLCSLRYLDLSGLRIGKDVDWFHPVINMLPSLHTLNLAYCYINIPSEKIVNFTSLKSLDLAGNSISSTIPVWLSNLTGLMFLDLFDNEFHGKIPDFLGVFNDITFIDLSQNMFSDAIPASIGLLLRLEMLNLQSNQLTGNIPTSLGLLLRLEKLHLQNNELRGNIPTSLGLLLMLEYLELQGNQLSGNIPMSLGQLSKLKYLDLSCNSFTEVLSETHFTNLNNLNYLDLSSNSLTLNFSSRWIPPFQLESFYASSTHIGPLFPTWLQTQRNLTSLNLSNSGISDTIPEWFEDILSRIKYLDLSSNQIGGSLPGFHGVRQASILKMNSNKFEGSLATFPSNVRHLDLSDNLLSGSVPQTDETMNPSLKVVDLSKNHFTGSIQEHLCKVPSIQVLDLSQNKFSGTLPECLGNLIHLNVIDVANNTITGVVPSSLGSLEQLNSLHLQNNRFEGKIPVSLQNLTKLVTVDLGNNLFVGTAPFWIGEYLRFLNLQSNKFTGNIPLHLCQLKSLQYLSLAHSNISGTIPHCFGNLSGMITTSADDFISYNYINIDYEAYYEENILASTKGRELSFTKTIKFLRSLDLSSNNIVGEIPDALMNLVGLKNLNLSGNLLKGPIPVLIGNLSQLESLDLSMNKLCGRIPQSLTSLTFLSYLNLSFNNLSGPIPVGNQLQTLDAPSIYAGNKGLCGPPVSRSCNGNDSSSYTHVGEDEGQGDTQDWWLYAGIGPGFVVGFVGLLGSLHFIRRWRVAYFEILKMFTGG